MEQRENHPRLHTNDRDTCRNQLYQNSALVIFLYKSIDEYSITTELEGKIQIVTLNDLGAGGAEFSLSIFALDFLLLITTMLF